jgi:hypothetical protein
VQAFETIKNLCQKKLRREYPIQWRRTKTKSCESNLLSTSLKEFPTAKSAEADRPISQIPSKYLDNPWMFSPKHGVLFTNRTSAKSPFGVEMSNQGTGTKIDFTRVSTIG